MRKRDPDEEGIGAVDRGVEAFAFWSGHPEKFDPRDRWVSSLPPRLLAKFSQIGGIFSSPPSGNSQSLIGSYLQATTDRLFWELANELKIEPLPFWPQDAPYAICLTHDIDRIQSKIQQSNLSLRKGRIARAIRILRSRNIQKEDPFYNFERILQYEEEWDIQSAIYVLFEKKRYFRAVLRSEWQNALGVYDPFQIQGELRQMRSKGKEIGLHGSLDAFLSTQALTQEMNQLRAVLGVPDGRFGVRNHYLQFHHQRTPLIQKECGALYDSTIGFNFTCGFPCGTTFPFMLDEGLMELPLAVMDTALKYTAPGKEIEVADRLAEEVRTQSGLLMINWHQRFCNRETNPEMFGWVDSVIAKGKQDHAFIAKPVEVVHFWDRRGMPEAG